MDRKIKELEGKNFDKVKILMLGKDWSLSYLVMLIRNMKGDLWIGNLESLQNSVKLL